jgi:hypothetical protein
MKRGPVSQGRVPMGGDGRLEGKSRNPNPKRGKGEKAKSRPWNRTATHAKAVT